MTQQPPAPTSADVARLAGVSRATVSYVLNDAAGGRVGRETRLRVREAAEKLGYVPHAAARSLRAGRTGVVLMNSPDAVWGPLFNDHVSSLRTELRARGYVLVIYGDTGAGAGSEAVARQWAELRPAAVLAPLGGNPTPAAVELLKHAGTRAVFTLSEGKVPGAHALNFDQRSVGAAATAHLLRQGRRALGVIVPADRTLELFSLPRLAGVQAAVDATALPAGGAPIRVERIELDYTEEAAARLAADWPSLGLDALFAYNDEYAMLVLSAFQDAGITVPDHVSLVGADDLMLCRLLRPRLTSVSLPMPTGEFLAALIDRLVQNPDGPEETHDYGEARIVVRESG
jgi:DNA-binding LacI/PurR family transcriptional regulator